VLAWVSPVHRILAVIGRFEDRRDTFFSPNLISCPFWVRGVILVTLKEVAVNASLAFLDGPVVAVVDDSSCHPTEHRLDNVQELGTCRKRDQGNSRSTVRCPIFLRVDSFHFPLERLFELCQDAASHEKQRRSCTLYWESSKCRSLIISVVFLRSA
jgi:hypothetical protein